LESSQPSVSEWLQNGTPITAATLSNFYQVSPTAAQVSNYGLQLGNDIAPVVFLTVPISVGTGTPTVYIQYEINVVAPSLQGTPHGPGGEPTPSDIVAAAQRFASAYSGVLNTNDCGFIASDLAAAAGAPLDDLESESLNPLANQSAGFWRVVYQGTSANAVANWQNLVQPGDIVRMGWSAGGQHTTTVLSLNADGSITVFDNNNSNAFGQEDIGIHRVNYSQLTIPTTITIFRLTPDGLYLINGNNSSGEILNGIPLYNNEIVPGSGNDVINCGPHNDVVQITAASTGSKVINGGGGNDEVAFPVALAGAHITDLSGHVLGIVGNTIINPSAQDIQISWSSGSETLSKISAVKFTDQSLTISTTASDDTVNLTAPASITVTPGVNNSISGVQVVDDALGGETFMVMVTDATGNLSATGSNVTGSGTHTLQINGTLGAVNATLATLGYNSTSTAGDTISVTVTDSDGSTITKNISATTIATAHTVTSVERFFDTATNDHFYTSNPAEIANIRATLPTFHDEGSPWGTPNKGPDTVDVYRFFDTATGDHFYTSNVAERDNIIAHNPTYHFEGVGFEAYTAQEGGTLTLERFFNTIYGVHHYSASVAETAAINAGAVGPGWVEEGPGFIVHA
jgi:Repeat of unknown function (DUF5648)